MYGGTERVVAYLTDALVELGHDVTLFASADARTKALLFPARDQSIRLDPCPLKSDVAAHLTMLHDVRRHFGDFDVLHFHIEPLQFPVFEGRSQRTLTTLHGRLDVKDIPALYERWSDFPLVSISNSQRAALPAPTGQGRSIMVCRRGCCSSRRTTMTTSSFWVVSHRKSAPIVPSRSLGRMGMPLKIAAKVDAVDKAYFRAEIEPLMDSSLVEFIGEIGEEEKSALLGKAAALLFPIDWPEPFGLVMIEAMACGTPVIAWDCGSVREVLDHGVTGFIVNSEEEAMEAVRTLHSIDRHQVRSVFEHRFTAHVMARSYLTLYRICSKGMRLHVGPRAQRGRAKRADQLFLAEA